MKPGGPQRLTPVVEALREAAERPPEDYQTQQGWVLIALQNAFYQLLHAPTLEEGVVQTVMAGGDTDTNAAIAGALLGAVHGRDAIPPQWLRSILSCRPLPKSGTSHPRPDRVLAGRCPAAGREAVGVGITGTRRQRQEKRPVKPADFLP